MFGLDVTLLGKTPSTKLESYELRMANSDPGLFEISPSQFQIVDAYFAWEDHKLVITTDLAGCSCINCT